MPPTWKQYPDGLAKPHELRAIYGRGHQGAYRSPEDSERLAESFEFATFRDVIDEHELDRWSGNESHAGLYLPFRSVLHFEPRAYDVAQQTGDCVSFWARNHSDAVRAGDILTRWESESWQTIGATEAIYGARSSYRAGMSCARAVEYLTRVGGMLLRKSYPSADLTTYDPELAIRWGRASHGGAPDGINAIAQEHQIGQATVVEDLESVRVAFRCGFSVGGCSGLGISSQRDARGISEQRGRWAHAMWWGGYDERSQTVEHVGEPLVLVVNSWGRWNRGPRRIHGTTIDIPEGACWLRESVIKTRCVDGGGCYTMAGADGWAPIKLPNLGATDEI